MSLKIISDALRSPQTHKFPLGAYSATQTPSCIFQVFCQTVNHIPEKSGRDSRFV